MSYQGSKGDDPTKPIGTGFTISSQEDVARAMSQDFYDNIQRLRRDFDGGITCLKVSYALALASLLRLSRVALVSLSHRWKHVAGSTSLEVWQAHVPALPGH